MFVIGTKQLHMIKLISELYLTDDSWNKNMLQKNRRRT